MKQRTWKAWCGFTTNEPDLDSLKRLEASRDGYGTLYATKAEARRYYQDVRRVEIREVH